MNDTAPSLTLDRIHQYVWARYVSYEPPPFTVDEDQALSILESHYRTHPMAGDAECFYYGILAFERSFAHTDQRRPLLLRALQAFQAYRGQVGPDAWEKVEDRYRELMAVLRPATAPETTG